MFINIVSVMEIPLKLKLYSLALYNPSLFIRRFTYTRRINIKHKELL